MNNKLNSKMSAETAADKSGADDITTSSHSSANTFVGSPLHIVSNQCVNSKWIASWLAKKGQECCECIVECKIRVNCGDELREEELFCSECRRQ